MEASYKTSRVLQELIVFYSVNNKILNKLFLCSSASKFIPLHIIDQAYADNKEQQFEVVIHTLCNIWKQVLFLPWNSAPATHNYLLLLKDVLEKYLKITL
jgi:hypothetical protein